MLIQTRLAIPTTSEQKQHVFVTKKLRDFERGLALLSFSLPFKVPYKISITTQPAVVMLLPVESVSYPCYDKLRLFFFSPYHFSLAVMHLAASVLTLSALCCFFVAGHPSTTQSEHKDVDIASPPSPAHRLSKRADERLLTKWQFDDRMFSTPQHASSNIIPVFNKLDIKHGQGVQVMISGSASVMYLGGYATVSFIEAIVDGSMSGSAGEAKRNAFLRDVILVGSENNVIGTWLRPGNTAPFFQAGNRLPILTATSRDGVWHSLNPQGLKVNHMRFDAQLAITLFLIVMRINTGTDYSRHAAYFLREINKKNGRPMNRMTLRNIAQWIPGGQTQPGGDWTNRFIAEAVPWIAPYYFTFFPELFGGPIQNPFAPDVVVQ